MTILREKLSSITNITGDRVEFKETTNTLKTIIKKHGLLTGSYLFDVQNEESDRDILIPPYVNITFEEIIAQHNGIYLHEDEENDIDHYFQEGFSSCYVLANNEIVNLILPHNQEHFERWVYASGMMVVHRKDKDFFEKIKNKEFRVEMFEKFKEEYNGNN